MSNKTVTHKGDIYEVRKPYMFRDTDSDEWTPFLLKNATSGGEYPFRTINGPCFNQIRAIEPSDLGTIKKAPVEFVVGYVYMFEVRQETWPPCGEIVGHYKEDGYFRCGLAEFDPADCTNIRRMVVEEIK